MTDKEKAVKWIMDNCCACVQNEVPIFTFAEQAYLAGLNADRWHYPSKGEYPPEGEEVLIRIDKKNYLGTYDGEVMWDIPLAEITCSGDWVDMWQYIVPPKEDIEWF